MDNTNKVEVKCMVNHGVSIRVPALGFYREWLGKDATQKIDKDTLEQLMYDPGVKYMFDNAILYIEDLPTKQEIGLEPEDVTQPTNIIVLNDKQRRECLIKMPFKTFKETVDKLSVDQVVELAQYAIDNKLIDYDRDEYIKSKCGRDIINTIRLNNQQKEG